MNLVRTILSALACAMLLNAASAQGIEEVTTAGLKHMLTRPGTDVVGARRPDVIIVEYFDYNCPYCKQVVPALQALLAQDPKIGVLYKDWPILGPVSVYAASSALAAGWQGKYQVAHEDGILQRAGVNMETLNQDRTRHAKQIAALLERNDEEAHALTLEGTPGLVVGRQLLHGIVDLAYLKKLVAIYRHENERQSGS